MVRREERASGPEKCFNAILLNVNPTAATACGFCEAIKMRRYVVLAVWFLASGAGVPILGAPIIYD
jgi:hypothetical protein